MDHRGVWMDPVLEPGAALDRLAAWQGRIDRLAADTGVMSDRLAALRVTATDPTRTVEVTVDSQGAVVDLKLGPRIQHLEPDRVAEAILATIHEANRHRAARAREIVEATLGTDSPAAREIADRVGDR